MQMSNVNFCTTDWDSVTPVEYAGSEGKAIWKTQEFGDIRVRLVEYTPGYFADHWCNRGHIVFIIDGEIETELADGRKFTLRTGMSYQVGTEAEAHRSSTLIGAKLFIVD